MSIFYPEQYACPLQGDVACGKVGYVSELALAAKSMVEDAPPSRARIALLSRYDSMPLHGPITPVMNENLILCQWKQKLNAI